MRFLTSFISFLHFYTNNSQFGNSTFNSVGSEVRVLGNSGSENDRAGFLLQESDGGEAKDDNIARVVSLIQSKSLEDIAKDYDVDKYPNGWTARSTNVARIFYQERNGSKYPLTVRRNCYLNVLKLNAKKEREKEEKKRAVEALAIKPDFFEGSAEQWSKIRIDKRATLVKKNIEGAQNLVRRKTWKRRKAWRRLKGNYPPTQNLKENVVL